MMTASESPITVLDRLEASCQEGGSLVVHAGIHRILDSCYLDLNESAFFTVLAREKPPTVFVQARQYDPDAFIRSVMISEGWDASFEDDPQSAWPSPADVAEQLSEQLAGCAHYAGTTCSVLATYAVGGLNRICWITSDWANDLSDAIILACERRHLIQASRQQATAQALEGLIEEIANDPKFRAIRGRPKRLLYVEKVYGDRIPTDPRGRVSRPAQNCSLVDNNLAIVLIKADDRTSVEDF